MKRRNIIQLGIILISFALLPGVALAQESGENHTEPVNCAGCHRNGSPMPVVVQQWNTSEHGNSYDEGSGANTYCARCKAPLNADPLATYRNNKLIPVEEWKDVTCSACHPPHDKRVEWGTPIGIYNISTQDWTPVYNPNELCVNCHTGSNHAKDFHGFGQAMYDKKEVQCNDCHMPEVPVEVEGGIIRDTQSHTWRVEENLPYSCGVEGTGCHANKKLEWAVKEIEKMKIHDSNENNFDNWPYYPGGESPP